MNKIYQSIKIIPLILILICNASFADANLESYRTDSNDLVTQKLNDGKLIIKFNTSQVISLKNVTLSINNIILNHSDYNLNCDILENSDRCTITINPINTLLLNGKIILRAEDGNVIATSNSNHELAFALDKSNPDKLKISNLLIDRSVIINAINSKPVLTNSTISPLGTMMIDLPEDGVTLECRVDSENLSYAVKKTKPVVAPSDPSITSSINSKTLAMLVAGGGGVIIIAACMGALSHKSSIDRKIAPKSQKYQQEIDGRVTKINLDLASAKAKNISTNFTAANNCILTPDNLEIGRKVKKLTEESTLVINEAEQVLQTYEYNLSLAEINFIKIIDWLNEAKAKAEDALKKAKEAEELVKTCTNKLKDTKLKLERTRRKQTSIKEEEQTLTAKISGYYRKINEIQKQQDSLDSGSQKWQDLEASKKQLRKELEADERDKRQSVANYNEQQSMIEQTEQELFHLNTLQDRQRESLMEQYEQVSEQLDSVSDTSKFAQSTAALHKRAERKFSDSIEEIAPQLQNPTIVYNPGHANVAPIDPRQKIFQPFGPSGGQDYI